MSEIKAEMESVANDVVEKVKALVAEGNVTRIRVRKDDTVILNLPMTAGAVGAAIGLAAAPWALIIAAISTVGFQCTVEVEKKDGTVNVVYGK